MNRQYSTITLYSNPRNVSKIESYLETLVERLPIQPDIYGNILISLTEAVTNAIMHGNQKDENKIVNVKCELCEKKLSFRVSDEGQGFDYNTLPDPTEPANLLNPNGRGVFLMHQLSDQVTYHDNGSTVEINFHLT